MSHNFIKSIGWAVAFVAWGFVLTASIDLIKVVTGLIFFWCIVLIIWLFRAEVTGKF